MSSPALGFSHLLCTNDPLNSNVKQRARLQVATLKKRLDDLRLLRRQIESEVEEYHLLLSPWRDMPVEIIGAIFKFVIPPVIAARAKDLGNLRLVCKKWRDVADLTHQLWSGLEVNVSDRGMSYEKLSSWLNKAGDLRRTLAVRGDSHILGQVCVPVHPALCRILTQGPTVDTLKISCPCAVCFERFTQEIQSRAAQEEIPSRWHSITSLILSFEHDRLPERTPPIFPSSLKSLALTLRDRFLEPWRPDGMIMGFIHPAVFEQLIDFSYSSRGSSLRSILPGVRHCVNAEVLTILGGHEHPLLRQGYDEETIHLPKLKTLRLGGSCPSIIPLALNTIQAPNLVHLDVDLGHGEYNCRAGDDLVLPSTIPPANLACRASLKQLRIRSAVVPYPDVVLRIVMNLPSLVHLILDDTTVNRNLGLRNLSMEDREDHVPPPLDGWPRIEVLELLERSKEHFANSRIMELLVKS
ncbi:hypothetical protein EST38_g2769 [Candolleomyces aberdarensis]|uniref:F-box domain-containing protein n=1 Tax=Candolleomyces aberdarensis TaxID=2316362 RepID=A0A4Q2DRM0_9AGAR|nr:hypothetical protein EST38_g2769 [Candolleomyces aberdarensis]